MTSDAFDTRVIVLWPVSKEEKEDEDGQRRAKTKEGESKVKLSSEQDARFWVVELASSR